MINKISILIDSSEIEEHIPPLGEGVRCVRRDCSAPNFEVSYGLAGGGCGVYEYCPTCGRVVSKSMDAEI